MSIWRGAKFKVEEKMGKDFAHAAPSANAASERNDEEEFVSSARVRTGNCAPRDECVDSELRRGRHRFSSAQIATTSLHYHQRDAGDRSSVAG